MNTVLIRTDASNAMGTGHVMRCLSLAQEYKKTGGNVVFVKTSKDLDERIESEGFSVHHIEPNLEHADDAHKTHGCMAQHGAEWIVVDGYHFSSEYQRALQERKARVLFFDDYGHCSYYCSDIILNQNITADASLYKKKAPETQLLLGTDFVVLRNEFRDITQQKHVILAEANKVLITLGGSDPYNISLKMLDALCSHSDSKSLDIQVIVGGANVHLESLELLQASSNCSISIACNVSDMMQRMQWADIAISAAGTTSWELLYMGVPCITGYMAENQVAIADALGREHLAVSMGDYQIATAQNIADGFFSLRSNEQLRSRLSVGGQCFVDGNGARRVLDAMEL